MRRTIVGMTSVALLLASAACFFWQHEAMGIYRLSGYLVRSGAVLGGVWLVWPEIAGWNLYLVGASVVAGGIVVMQPGMAFYVVPLYLAFYFFFPWRRRGGGRRIRPAPSPGREIRRR